MKLISRNSDVILNHEDLVELYCFKNFPVFMGCTNQSHELDLLSNMNWSISKKSGAIQLNPLLPLEVVYKEQHGSGCIGESWNHHHKAFAQFIHNFNFKTVLEIGGLHGILSKMYLKLDKSIDWSIIEPNPIPDKEVTANFIKGYFDEHFKFEKPVDAILHSHVFEHMYDPHLFLQNISNFLSDGKYLLFSLPNLEDQLKRKYTNVVNFEHTIFLTEPYIEYLLSQYNFRIVKQVYYNNEHSIFYACIRDSKTKPINLPKDLFQYNKKIFLEYLNYHQKLIKDLNAKIKMLKKNQKLYLFGAHVNSQYLINFGLDVKNLVSIIDNDPNKHGKRLYGTKINVNSPKILKNDVEPIVILKSGVFNQEIKEDIIKNINSKTIFL